MGWMPLKELIVKNYVKKWLEERWKKPVHIIHDGADVDFLVWQLHLAPSFYLWLTHFEAMECKGTKSNVHRAIGQCLHYYWSYGRIPTYLAVPNDYKKLETLERVLKFFDLPIGILLVDSNGEVLAKMEAKGKKRYFKLFRNGKGNFINKPP